MESREVAEGFPKFKTKTPKKAPKPPRRVSKKREAQGDLLARISEECKKEAKYKCQGKKFVEHACAEKEKVDADHIEHRSTHPELIFEKSNLQCLCWKLNTVKELEPLACKIVGLFGKKQQDNCRPISRKMKLDAQTKIQEAVERL